MKPKMTSRQLNNLIVKVAILSAIAFILQLLEFPIPLMPFFLTLDLSDLPALIGAFSLGPIAGIAIQLVKNLLFFLAKDVTGGIGPVANFVAGSALVATAGYIYQFKKTRQGALAGMAVGTLVMTALMAVGNYYAFIPLYEKVLNFPVNAVIGVANTANPYLNITDLRAVIVYSFVPFNILKGVMVSAATFFVYKHISPLLHKN